jgi:hypothetical protein
MGNGSHARIQLPLIFTIARAVNEYNWQHQLTWTEVNCV